MVLVGAVVAGGAGGTGGVTVCGAGGTGFAGTRASRSSSCRSRLWRQSRLLDTETHVPKRQCLEDSMCTRRPPTLNEIEPPASAEELSAISTARKQNRFIEASRG